MDNIETDKKVNIKKNNNLTNKTNINHLDKNNNIENENTYDDERIKVALNYLDINQSFPIFKQNNIKFNDLLLLTRNDLIELNFTLVERNRLLNFSKNYLKNAKTFSIGEINNFFNEYKILNISLTNPNSANKKNKRLNTVENDNIIKSSIFNKQIKLKIFKNDDDFNENEYKNLCSYTVKHVDNGNNYKDKNNVITEVSTVIYNGKDIKNKNNNIKNLKYKNHEEKEKNKNTMSIEKVNFGFSLLNNNTKNQNKINKERTSNVTINKTKSSNNFFTKFTKLSLEINEYFKNIDKQNKINEIKEINKFEQKEKEKNEIIKKKIEKNKKIQKNIRELRHIFQKNKINNTKEKVESDKLINTIKNNKYLSKEKIEKLKQLKKLKKQKENLKNQLMHLYDKDVEIKNIIKFMDEIDD